MSKDFDTILDKFCSRGDLWQWKQFLLLYLQCFTTAIPFYLHMFAAFSPRHRCFVPICDNNNNTSIDEPWTDFAIPKNELQDEFLQESNQHSQCLMVKPRGSNCEKESFKDFYNNTEVCERYVYDKSIFEETLTTKLDLVCDQDHLTKLLGTILMLGLMVGCVVGGAIGDRLGRKTALILSNITLIPLVISGGFVNSYEAYAVLRFFTYLCISVNWLSTNAMMLELFGRDLRKFCFVAISIGDAEFCLVTVLIAYLERHWTYMHLWCGLAMAASVPILAFGMSESIRWMLVNKKGDQAEKIVMGMVKKDLTKDEVKEIKTILESLVEKSDRLDKKMTIIDMFRKRYLKTTLTVLSAWVTSIVSYYAIALNSTDLAGDLFLNYTYGNLVEIPSILYIFLSVDRIGRRWSLVLPMSLLGTVCLAMAFVPKTYSGLILALYLLGKFSSSSAAFLVWFYTAELFPTNLRAQSVGTCSLVARIFGMCAPFVENLGLFWSPLPFLVLGVPTLVSAGLCWYMLPETKGKALPDTEVDDGNDIKDNDFGHCQDS